MAPAAGGWWAAEAAAAAGDDYAYSIDGGAPRPDPRSPWQPSGVHGSSAVVDHSLFEWSDASWAGGSLAEQVIYELHTGTFTPEGTFAAAEKRLDHLVELGATAVELMPAAEFPGDHGWGYDGVDLYAPHHSYGGPDGLKGLIDACHARGLAVIMDVVYNHLGPAGNYLREFGPYFTDRYSTPWGDSLNFDGPDSSEVRELFVQNALMWLRDYHCDGLRLDAVHAIVDTSALHLLEEIGSRARALEAETGRALWIIAESDLNDPRLVNPQDAGGYGLDAQWSDDFHHSLHALLTGERSGYYVDFGSIEHLAKALRNAFVYDGIYSAYRRRRHGRTPAGLPGHKFIGFLQNHDQIGNRVQGERAGQLMSNDLLKVGAALVLTSPFVPLLFQGEEWGAATPFVYFTDHQDPELGAAVSEGRRREFEAFGWEPSEIPDPQDPQTFARSKLDWSELEDPQHADMLDWHRRLIALRKRTPELTDGRLDAVVTRFDERAGWLLIERGPISIACNFSALETDVPGVRRMDPLLCWGKEPVWIDGSLRLGPEAVAILGKG